MLVRCLIFFCATSIAAVLTLPIPNAAAVTTGLFVEQTSQEHYKECIKQTHRDHPTLGDRIVCRLSSIVFDPVSAATADVNSFSLTVLYNPSIQTFDPSRSGPLGVFSVGGDSPPVNPGIGTEVLRLLPSSGYSPGAPLPDSVLTYTNINGMLKINYQLANAVPLSTEVNFFIVSFLYKDLLVLPPKLSDTLVTYETQGPGRDYSVANFGCTTTKPSVTCGSNNPSTGITVTVVSEPSSLLLLGIGVVFMGLRICRASSFSG